MLDIQELEFKIAELTGQISALEAELAEASDLALEMEVAEESDEEPHYVASERRKKIHRPACDWAARISEGSLVEFGSLREALEANYKRCRTCKP